MNSRASTHSLQITVYTVHETQILLRKRLQNDPNRGAVINRQMIFSFARRISSLSLRNESLSAKYLTVKRS